MNFLKGTVEGFIQVNYEKLLLIIIRIISGNEKYNTLYLKWYCYSAIESAWLVAEEILQIDENLFSFAHNSLYGQLHEELIIRGVVTPQIKSFELWITNEGISKDRKRYIDHREKSFDYSLPTYIRNKFHHPENDKNPLYTEKELVQSTNLLINLNIRYGLI